MLKAYVNGELTSAERHAVEHAALRDVAVRDALEGYEHLKESKTNLSAVNSRLKNKLQGRIEKSEKKNVIIWWKYGLAASVLFGVIISSYLLFNNLGQNNLALEANPIESQKQETLPDVTYDQEVAKAQPEPPASANNYTPQKLLNGVKEPVEQTPGPLASKPVEGDISQQLAETANSTAAESAVKDIPPITKQAQELAAVAAAPAERSAKRVAASIKLNSIAGKVTDEKGEPLPGVTVNVKGKTEQTKTNIKGEFELKNASAADAIQLSHIGFEQKEVKAKDTEKAIVLSEDSAVLSEMVITGYGKTLPDQEATPKNGWDSFRKNLIISSKTEGEVVLVLTISPEGKVAAKEIKKGLGEPYDSQAINLPIFNELWIPARKNGKAIEQKMRVVVGFTAK